jgi:glucose-1-phosphate adenylyltransferase
MVRGTTDAVFQNIDIIDAYEPEYLVVLAGDHVYKMDYEQMLVQHVNAGADVTVACVEVPTTSGSAFGIMQVDASDRIVDFLEKPAHPPELPDRPGWALASMGIYVFKRSFCTNNCGATPPIRIHAATLAMTSSRTS